MDTALMKKNGCTTESNVRPVRGTTYTPRVDIVENDEELTLCVDLPGVRPEDLEIRFEQGELELHGKVTPREGQASLREYGTGDFRRVFRLGEDVDANGISATLKFGVLTLRLPKAERAKPRRIEVKS